MAQTKPELSKSDIIRDFVTKNPTLSISEVATMLGEQRHRGIKEPGLRRQRQDGGKEAQGTARKGRS